MRDPNKYFLCRSAALPGEGSWGVTYTRYIDFDSEYELIAGFLTKKQATALLNKLKAEAIGAQSPMPENFAADQMPLL